MQQTQTHTTEQGYITDVAYPPHFYKEMQPLWLTTISKFQNANAPDIQKSFSYCELGCGMGINLLIAAANNPNGYFIGVDFNARHIEIARSAVAFSGLNNIHFVHSDFATFAKDNRFYFDFISCHGTWSWIAPEHQQTIVSIVNQALKPGGIFYLHYMVHPGSTHLIPVQKLLQEFAQHVSGNTVQKIQQAMQWLQQLANAGAFIDQPNMAQHIQVLATKDAHYLAHEFLTDHWNPQHASDIHHQLSHNGLDFIGSANAFENMDELSVPGDMQPMLAGLTPGLQENVRDLARNQRQRTDLFQKKISPSQSAITNPVDTLVFQLLPGAPVTGGFSFKTPIGEIPAPAEMFSPLLQTLAKKPTSEAELKQLPLFSHQPELLAQALQMLMWAEYIHPQQPNTVGNSDAVKKLTEWMERHSLAIEIINSCATAIRRK